jgi:hypothetical protein
MFSVCPDNAFWANCDRAEKMLADMMDREDPVSADELIELFITPWPKGLNKDGAALHPNQTAAPEYTLITVIALLDEKRYMRYQRDMDGIYPESREVRVY